MVHRSKFPIRWFAVALAVAMLVLASGSAQAAGRSRVLGVSFFVLGIGLKFGGAVVGTGAAETYDDYLLTADQGQLTTLREDFRSERRLSDGLSGAGNGLLAAGLLFATLSLLRDSADGGDSGDALALAQAPPSITLTRGVTRRDLGIQWNYGF